jgi:3'(2'), 5'-bisphosphate nucleotidase
MSAPAYAKELSVALKAVQQAAELCQQVRSTLNEQDSVTKGDLSPVTVADFGAQAVVLKALAQAFPEDPVVGEEDADALRADAQLSARVLEQVKRILPEATEASVLEAIDRGNHTGGPKGRFWTLDPIDGTKGFLRNDQYAVALALIEDGQVVLGVLGCPALPEVWADPEAPAGCFLTAVKGQGTALYNRFGNPLAAAQASKLTALPKARVCESVESGHSRHDWASEASKALGIVVPSVRMDSQCKYAALARGDAEIYLRLPTRPGYQEKIWDHAAGALCVTEAGGCVTDINGKALDFAQGTTLKTNSGIIASAGIAHHTVVEAVRATRPES